MALVIRAILYVTVRLYLFTKALTALFPLKTIRSKKRLMPAISGPAAALPAGST
jgi:hypothetical protein